MSNNVKMMIVNEFDGATLSLESGTIAPSLPVNNLQTYNNSRRLRTTSTDFVLVGDFDDITLCTGIVLWRHNFTAAATLRVELFGGAGQSGDLIFDSGVIDALPQSAWTDWDWRVDPLVNSAFQDTDTQYSQIWFGEFFVRSFRISVSDTANPAGYLDLTRIYMGRHFSPSVNFSWGSQLSFGSADDQLRTDDAGLFGKDAPLWRKYTFTLQHLDESDRSEFSRAITHARRFKDWFISLYPSQGGKKELDGAFACKFVQLPPLTSEKFNAFNAQVSVEEC